MQLMNILGWAGVTGYVCAYGLLSIGWLSADKAPYHVINAACGFLLAIFSYASLDIPNMTVNAVWVAIAAFSIARIVIKRKKRRSAVCHASSPREAQDD